jgi:hypothetical protein
MIYFKDVSLLLMLDVDVWDSLPRKHQSSNLSNRTGNIRQKVVGGEDADDTNFFRE